VKGEAGMGASAEVPRFEVPEARGGMFGEGCPSHLGRGLDRVLSPPQNYCF